MLNKKHSQGLSLGATSIAAALTFGSNNALAQQECNQEIVEDCSLVATNKVDEAIEQISIHGIRYSIYRVNKSGDLRRLADLVDTPQTINVLTQDQIQESGRTDLQDILAAQSGITLGTGENGNAFGDRYIIRGHEARSDVFVDGLRDPGMTTRESFATEKVEITKGPSSTFAGRGSSGGAVNSITKKASTSYDFGRVDLSLGSDDYFRLSADYNAAISENAALRINLLTAEETKPNRDRIERSRDGLQVSGIIEATEDLSFIADFYYLDANDRPDLGSYFDRSTRTPTRNILVYAQQEDLLASEVNTFTLRTHYAITDNITLYNATRSGTTENAYIATGANASIRANTDLIAPGTDTISLSTHQGWQEVDYVTTQFNLFITPQIYGLTHQLVFGLEYTNESVDNGVFDINFANPSNCAVSGRRGVTNGYCALDGSGNIVANIGSLMGKTYIKANADALFDIETISLYVMDTVALTEKTNLFFGLRQDSFDYSNDTSGRNGDILYEYSDTLYNGHLGLVYELTENGNIYATYSTATNINGGESDLGANCGYGGICGDPTQAAQADPETIENIELGTKWMVFNEQLMATAAVFRMTKDDVMESVGDSYSTLGTINTGKNRVQGAEFGLSGDIIEGLSIQASASLMDSEVLSSFSNSNIGLALSNFAQRSYYLQLRYQVNEAFSFGGDYSYQSEMFGGQPDTAADYDQVSEQYNVVVPSYSVLNFFANYNINEKLSLRINLSNALDEEYWTAAYRSGAFMYLGDGRNLRANINYEF